jgi:hypothetical protein
MCLSLHRSKDMEFLRKVGQAVVEFLTQLGDAWSLPVSRIVIALLPKPVSGRGFPYRSGYAAFYYSAEEEVIGWHKKELERLDSDYARQQASFKLVAARAEALKNGIGPSDPRYPDIFDFYKMPSFDAENPSSGDWLSELLPVKKKE